MPNNIVFEELIALKPPRVAKVKSSFKDCVKEREGNAPVYIVGKDLLVKSMLEKMGFENVIEISAPMKTAERLQKPAFVVFTGGADVSPILYGAKNEASVCDINRDLTELLWFKWFQKIPVLKIGICRGGQFLNVMSGGSMVQDIDGHGGNHEIQFRGEISRYLALAEVTSTHHQGMLAGLRSNVFAISKNVPGRYCANEIIWYGDTRSLCFQPHPEYDHEGTLKVFESVCACLYEFYI